MKENNLNLFRHMLILLVLLTLPLASIAQTGPTWQAGLKVLVDQRIADHQFVDGAVGVVSSTSSEVATFGKAKTDTIFEIGSITKAFTGIIFAQMVNEKVVSPSYTVELYIPELKGTFAGQIVLSELASHTSGLARIPPDIPFNSNPYAKYTWSQLLNYLKTAAPYSEAKVRPFPARYSNTGFALLGQILAQVDNTDFSHLVAKRIAKPLGMNDTVMVVDSEQASRFIEGYDTDLHVASHWDWDVFAPTGAVRSTLDDMLKFAKINLHPDSSSLGEAIKLSQSQNWGWDSTLLNLPWIRA